MMRTKTKKSYKELIKIPTFHERYLYLRTKKGVGEETFGSDRFLNQNLYHCNEWRSARRKAILRDDGCDLGIPNLKIEGKIIVHHIDPITVEDVIEGNPKVFDLNNLICVSDETHKAIHYGSCAMDVELIERKPNDHIPWR